MTDDRMTQLSKLAEQFAMPDESPDLPTYACPDCQDRGFIAVPCRIPLCVAYPLLVHDQLHRLVRCCLSCEAGIASEAGIWFRFLWERDRTGKPKLRKDRLPKFEAAMRRHGFSKARIQVALDRILERHKAEQMETP